MWIFAQIDIKSWLFLTQDETGFRAAVYSEMIAFCPTELCVSYKLYEFQLTHTPELCLPQAFRIALNLGK